MKVMMIFDQTQAGLGGKESPDLPMGGKAMGIGSCEMFTRFLDQQGVLLSQRCKLAYQSGRLLRLVCYVFCRHST